MLYLPRVYPNPKNISFQAIIVETLLGNTFINMETLEAQVAAKAVPSKNLHENDWAFSGSGHVCYPKENTNS